MRLLIVLMIGLVAGLIGGYVLADEVPPPISMARAAPCAARIVHPIAFTAQNSHDTIIVRSAGPCANLVASVTIRAADGHVVFVHAARIGALMDPKINPIAAKGVRAVLSDYAAMAEHGARTMLPPWPSGTAEVANIAPYGMFTPIAGNALYRKVRAENAPILRLRRGRETGTYFAYLPQIDETELVARYSL